jgi:hypothetical protein
MNVSGHHDRASKRNFARRNKTASKRGPGDRLRLFFKPEFIPHFMVEKLVICLLLFNFKKNVNVAMFVRRGCC